MQPPADEMDGALDGRGSITSHAEHTPAYLRDSAALGRTIRASLSTHETPPPTYNYLLTKDQVTVT